MPNKAFHHIIAIKIGKLAEIAKGRKNACVITQAN
jgi:hypothetical protein